MPRYTKRTRRARPYSRKNGGKKTSPPRSNTRRSPPRSRTPPNEEERRRMLHRLQELMEINQRNTAIMERLTEKLRTIERMTGEDREKNQRQYRKIKDDIENLLDANEEARVEFETLRMMYAVRYPVRTQAALDTIRENQGQR